MKATRVSGQQIVKKTGVSIYRTMGTGGSYVPAIYAQDVNMSLIMHPAYTDLGNLLSEDGENVYVRIGNDVLARLGKLAQEKGLI